MKKSILMAALASIMAIPATASAVPEANFRTEAPLFDVADHASRPDAGDPNQIDPATVDGEIGSVRYREESADLLSIDRQELRWSASGIHVFDLNRGRGEEADDGTQLVTTVWTFDGQTFAPATPNGDGGDTQGVVSDGNPILGDVLGGLAKLDARYRAAGGNDDQIPDIDENRCNVVVISDAVNGNSSMAGVLGTC